MEYEVSYFSYDQEEKFNTFIASFTTNTYESTDFVGSNFWSPHNTLGGFVLFAHTEREIAAICFITGRRLNVMGDILNCYELGGVNTFPAHQRKGLFTRLVKKAIDVGFLDLDKKFIYGTPNERAAPGYRKFGFSFADQKDTRLVLFPKFHRIILKKLGFIKGDIKYKNRNEEVSLLNGTAKVREINREEYIAKTINFPRMNYADTTYLTKRLASPSKEHPKRFFACTHKEDVFYFSFKNYPLQYLRTIMLSEYFLNGKKDNTRQFSKFARAICSHYYSEYDGIYTKTTTSPELSNPITFLRHKHLIHRTLPICVFENSANVQSYADNIIPEIFNNFQLTDCDFG